MEGGDLLKAAVYGCIVSLTRKSGYCYASNKYIAEKFDVHPVTVSKKVNELQEEGWIRTEIEQNHSRKIYLNKLITLNPETKGVKSQDLGGVKSQDLHSNINISNKRKKAATPLPTEELEEELTYEEDEELKPYNPLKRKKPLKKNEKNAVVKLCNMFAHLAGINTPIDAKPWLRPISGLYKACGKDYQATIDFMRKGIAYFEDRELSYTPHTLYKNKPLIDKWVSEEQQERESKFNNGLYA